MPTRIDESPWSPPDGEQRALERSQAKAQYALEHFAGPSALIIAADQTLSWNGQIFDKARDIDEARQRLTSLAGSTHHLHSAVSLGYKTSSETEIFSSWAISPALTMKALSSSDIDQYLATQEWRGSVGCYRIEGAGRKLFSYVGADHETIAGLPMNKLLSQLKICGVDLTRPLVFPLKLQISHSVH